MRAVANGINTQPISRQLKAGDLFAPVVQHHHGFECAGLDKIKVGKGFASTIQPFAHGKALVLEHQSDEFIALAGVSAEFGVIMLLYLRHAWDARLAGGGAPDVAQLEDAIREGAVLRVRPKAMTVAVIIAGLLPIMFGSGTGSEIMQRIAAPMVGGMITAPLLSMFVIPAAYLLMRRPRVAVHEHE